MRALVSSLVVDVNDVGLPTDRGLDLWRANEPGQVPLEILLGRSTAHLTRSGAPRNFAIHVSFHLGDCRSMFFESARLGWPWPAPAEVRSREAGGPAGWDFAPSVAVLIWLLV